MEKTKLKATNTAVLYDIENVREFSDLKRIIELVNDITDGKPFFNAAYTDWSNPAMEQKRILLQANGVIPHQVITYGGTVYKNSADIALSVDAMELLLDPDIENFILVTGDGGFTSLITKLKKHKRHIEVISVSAAFSKMINGYADEVHIISNNKEQEEVSKIRHPNDFSIEANKSYFKAIWAISKSVSEIDEALTLIFKNGSVRAQIKTLGLKMIILENALKMNCHAHHAKKVRDVILAALKTRQYKIIQKPHEGAIIIHQNIEAKINMGEYGENFTGEITRENICEYLSRKGYTISKGGGSAEIVKYIASNYTKITLQQKENFINEIVKNTKKRKMYVESIVNLMSYYGLSSSISDTTPFTLCKKIRDSIGKKDDYFLLNVLIEELFYWNIKTIKMSNNDEKKYRNKLKNVKKAK